VQAKVLPEAKGDIYREVGCWLNTHTRGDASIGVIEVGIIGYFADRVMVDFLGLLQPDVARALKRGDLYYAIPHYMPDYIVLGKGLYIYGMWLGGDDWFLDNYHPIKEFSDERFWGSPLVILERISKPSPIVEHKARITFTRGLTLENFGVEEKRLHPGDGIRVRLDWLRSNEMDEHLQIIAYLVDEDEGIVALRARQFDTSIWPENSVSSTYYPILLDETLPPGDYHLRVRIVMEDQTDAIHELTTLSVAERD